MKNRQNPNFTNNHTEALTSLKLSLIISDEDAHEIIKMANTTAQVARKKVYHYLVADLPLVIDFHIQQFQAQQKLFLPWDQYPTTNNILSDYPQSCSSFKALKDCAYFTPGFREFYQAHLYKLIEKKLTILLLGCQALMEQIGIDDFHATYKSLQTLTPAGMGQVLDFSWHAKVECIAACLEGKNFTSIYTTQFAHIPEQIQIQLSTQKTFAPNIYAAVESLRDVMGVDKETIPRIMNSLTAEMLTFIPKITHILLNKAIYLRLSGLYTEASSFAIAIKYYEIPNRDEDDHIWVKQLLFNKLPANFIDLVVSDALLEQLLQMPVPFYAPGTFPIDALTQEYNVQQYKRAWLSRNDNSSVPQWDLYNTTLPGFEVKQPIFSGYNHFQDAVEGLQRHANKSVSSPSSKWYSHFRSTADSSPDTVTLIAPVVVMAMVGVGLLARFSCRRFPSFWNKSSSSVPAQEKKVEAASYQKLNNV